MQPKRLEFFFDYGSPYSYVADAQLPALCARAGVFPAFHRAVYPAFWQRGLDLGSRDVLAGVLRGAGLDADALIAASADPEVKADLRANTEEAVARGAFGCSSAPTTCASPSGR